MTSKETISRRDFLRIAAVGIFGVAMTKLLSTEILNSPTKTYTPGPTTSTPLPPENPTQTPTTETPIPSKSPTKTRAPEPTETPTPFTTPDVLTPEKINFLATHNFIHGDPNEMNVMMTYDEGQNQNNVENLLDTYKRYGAKCTFFMTGAGLKESQNLLPRIVAEGHILGCHGRDHENMRALSNTNLKSQFDEWLQTIHQILPGYEVTYFRAPYGSVDERVLRIAASYGLQHVGWTVESGGLDSNTYDYVFKNFKIYSRYYNAQGGAIVLSHTHRPYDISQADKILNTWTSMGYKLVTVEEGKMDQDRWQPTTSNKPLKATN